MKIVSKTFISGHFNEQLKDLVGKNIFTLRFLPSKVDGDIINCVTSVNLISI